MTITEFAPYLNRGDRKYSLAKIRNSAGGGAAGERHANPYIEWMLAKGWHMTEPESLIKGLMQTMTKQGVAVLRLRVTIRTLHPQAIGHSFTWQRDTGEVEVF